MYIQNASSAAKTDKKLTVEELKTNARKEGTYYVSQGETLYNIAKKFNLSAEEFKKLTSLKSSTLSIGQTISNIPTATIKSGQGLATIAKANGMKLDEFLKLNNITSTYVPQAGEKFYVYPKATETTQQATQKTKPVVQPQEKSLLDAKQQRPTSYTVKSGDTLSAIASKYKMSLDEFKNWTGTKKNTLSIGQKINLPQASVPNGKGIISLAQKYNMDFDRFCIMNNIPEPRDKYVAKSGEQFYVVNGLKANGKPSSSNTSVVLNGAYTVPTSGYISVPADETHNVRVISGPAPIPVNQDGKVVAEVIRFEPLKNNTGELKGKTIMVNAGHGWKMNKHGKKLFHPGASYEDEKGRILEEWRKNRDFAEELIKNLRAKGATVIYTTGGDVPVNNAKKKYQHDLLISLHCNASSKSNVKGLQIYVDNDDYNKNGPCKEFADITAKKLNIPQASIKGDTQSQHDGIGLIRDTAPGFFAPSILLEMGFMSNSNDIKNIDSIKYRQESMTLVADAIVSMAEKNKQRIKNQK